jgi:hypothetical protein
VVRSPLQPAKPGGSVVRRLVLASCLSVQAQVCDDDPGLARRGVPKGGTMGCTTNPKRHHRGAARVLRSRETTPPPGSRAQGLRSLGSKIRELRAAAECRGPQAFRRQRSARHRSLTVAARQELRSLPQPRGRVAAAASAAVRSRLIPSQLQPQPRGRASGREAPRLSADCGHPPTCLANENREAL